MKRLVTIVLALAGTLTLWGYSPRVNEVRIDVELSRDGSARITEYWDVVVASGTEWYLTRKNLGDIEIRDLGVTDEMGNAFYNEGAWDVDRGIEGKARRCGLNKVSGGYEICWGVESYGSHAWTVSYTMTNVVKSLSDFDSLHMQFISPGLSSPPQNASITIRAPQPLDSENSRIWGFGFEGVTDWDNGSVTARSTEPFVKMSSMIMLIRFEKGIFQPASIRDISFDEILEVAMEGNTFEDEDSDDLISGVLAALATIAFLFFSIVLPFFKAIFGHGTSKKQRKERLKAIFGQEDLPSSPDWSRDVPFGGNVYETYYIAAHLKGVDDEKFTIISALILKFVADGVLSMRDAANGKKEFHFTGKGYDGLNEVEQKFLSMLKDASGKDKVLQEKEFARWCNSHESSVRKWVKELRLKVQADFKTDGLSSGGDYKSLTLNPTGNAKALQALGFRRYLNDFTLIEQRHVPEVALWGDYLVVAALFGIADKVAKEMDALAPGFRFAGRPVTYGDLNEVIVLSNVLRNATRNAYAMSSYSSGGHSSGGSRGGFGGHTSFGGGGGFSGGGFGGGSR